MFIFEKELLDALADMIQEQLDTTLGQYSLGLENLSKEAEEQKNIEAKISSRKQEIQQLRSVSENPSTAGIFACFGRNSVNRSLGVPEKRQSPSPETARTAGESDCLGAEKRQGFLLLLVVASSISPLSLRDISP